MTAQIRNETRKLYSYTDKDRHYCEVWGSDIDIEEDNDDFPDYLHSYNREIEF